MLSAGIIFDYVWLHFVSVYPEAQNLRVNYGGSDPDARLEIPAGSLVFFRKKVPFPDEVSWLPWQDRHLPVLFAEHPGNPTLLLQEKDGRVKLAADIIGSAFYFLSGWQEYYGTVRDNFNRFPYHESLQCRHDFVAVPVVNYYFEVLARALEKCYGISLKNSRENTLTTFLSHDVDRLESAWKVAGLKQLKTGNLLAIPKLAWQKLQGRDHWHNLKTVAETVKKLGGISTFFWLAQKGNYQNHPNADFKIAEPQYQELIRFLADEGFENGIHGSFGSSENTGQLHQEKAKLNGPVSGNRFHYLCFDPKSTPRVLSEAGIKYDSTLGFAEHFGFRHGYCYPFRLFDFSAQKPYPFVELPLNLMDTTLWHPNYLQVSPEKLAGSIRPMLAEIKKFGGVFSVLWHNENFSELNKKNGLQSFNVMMQELQQMHTSFRTGAQLYQEFADRLPEAKV